MDNLLELAARIINSSKAKRWPAADAEWAAAVAKWNSGYAASKVTVPVAAAEVDTTAYDSVEEVATPTYSARHEFKTEDKDD